MTSIRITVALLFGALFIAAPALAERRSLTVEQAIQLGLENSKSLHASAEKVNDADARASEANAARLPALKLSAAYNRLSSVPAFTISIPGFPPQTISPAILDNYNIQLTLQQPLFTGFRLESGARAASKSADAARLDHDKDRRELIFNVRTAYWNLFKAAGIKNVVDSSLDQMAAHLQDVQNLFAEGIATTNDVLKIQVQMSNVRLQQIDASNAVRLAGMALNTLIGLPLSTEIDVATTAVVQPRAFADAPALVKQALDLRPDIKAMEARVEAGNEAVTVARGGWWPQLFAVGTYTYARPNQRIFPTQDRFDGTWTAGLSLAWDLWTWGTAGYQTSQAESQLAQANDALGQIKDGVALEVTQNALLVLQAKERIAVSQQGVDQAQENLRVTNDKYRAGLVLNSEVLDAEVALQQARTSYTQTVVDYALAQAALEKAVGQ